MKQKMTSEEKAHEAERRLRGDYCELVLLQAVAVFKVTHEIVKGPASTYARHQRVVRLKMGSTLEAFARLEREGLIRWMRSKGYWQITAKGRTRLRKLERS